MSKSFFTIKTNDKKELLDWLLKTKDQLLDEAKNRVNVANYNINLYLGNDGLDKGKHNMSVPLLYNIIESNVNQMTRLNPKLRVIPAQDEAGDKGAARVSKAVIDHVMEEQQYHAKAITTVRNSYTGGEAFIQCGWDPSLGSDKKALKTLKDMGVKDIVSSKGKIGDIFIKTLPLWRVLLQNVTKMENVEYYFDWDILEIDKVAKDYGLTREQLLEGNTDKISDEFNRKAIDTAAINPEDMCSERYEDHIIVYNFWHKPTKYLEKGKIATFTSSKLLSHGDYPFSMQRLNIAQLCDLSLEDTLHGRSRIQLVSHLQRLYNTFTKLGAKYVLNTARTKYFAQIGSIVNPASLGNNDAISFYRGGIEPSLAKVPQLSGDLVGLKQDIANKMQIIMGMHDISNGELAKQVRATSTAQFLDSKEFEKASVRVKSYADLTEEVGDMIISIAGDFYKDEDERLVRLVGSNNRSLLRHFKSADLSKPFSIRFEGTDGFPETTAGKRDRLLEAMTINPALTSGERWFNLLELGDVEKLRDITGAALASAESENEDLMNGDTVFPPESFEDHIAHLEVHYPYIQSRDFKEFASNDVVDATLNHIQIHELFLLDIAQYNPTVSARLAQIPLFPITEAARKRASEVVRSQAQQNAVVQGQANRGEQVTDKIGDLNGETDGNQ